jgi:predicted MFS family arabinose efflux permease
VQWLAPLWGWRPLFWGLAVCILVSMVLIAWAVPRWETASPSAATAPPGYSAVWTHPYFRRMTPIGFFSYGGMIAIQTLWAGPWMVRVGGASPTEAATADQHHHALYLLELGADQSRWHTGMTTDRLIAWVYRCFIALAIILVAGSSAGAGAWPFFVHKHLCVPGAACRVWHSASGWASLVRLQHGDLLACLWFMGHWLLIDGFVGIGRAMPSVRPWAACSSQRGVVPVFHAPQT